MINLLPTHIKEERVYGRRNRMMLTYSVSLILTAAIIATVMMVSMQFVTGDEASLRSEIASTEVEIAALQNNIQDIEAVASRLETAKKLSDLSVKFSSLIPEIGSILPEGSVLNALALTGGKTDPLILDVDLKAADLAPVLSRNLVESDLFEAADIASLNPKGIAETETTSATSQSPYVFSASVSASFTGTAEAKRKEAAKEAARAAADEAKKLEETKKP